jgi:triacylglycerol lipase
MFIAARSTATKLQPVSTDNTARKIPVILHHGIRGFSGERPSRLRKGYYRGIDKAIGASGHPLIVTHVHPTGSVARRAAQLREIACRKLDEMDVEKAILIGHSMGGLDARHAITHLGLADRVAALFTVSTPHRGSSFADWWKLHFGRRLGAFKLAASLGLDIGAVNDLTLESCARFNETTPNVAGVAYYSVGASRPWHRIPAYAIPSYRIIKKVEGDNDGLVSVASSQWGTSLGVWPADHWQTINHRMVFLMTPPAHSVTPHYVAALQRIYNDLNFG